jgi:4-amino-4-deoxy-L-arabinose transferase-like glycosyltransferase
MGVPGLARSRPGARSARWIRSLPHDRTLLALIALGFLLRAVAYAANVKPGYLHGLLGNQTQMALAFLDHGKWFMVHVRGTDRYVPAIIEMPSLAMFDVVIWAITGPKSYTVITIMQIILDTAMIALVYWIALRLTARRRTALVSAGLYAIYPLGIVLAKTPALDTWAGFILIISTALFVWARERTDKPRRLIPLAILCGVGIYFRPTLFLLPIVLILACYPVRWRHRVSLALMAALISGAILLPWTMRNAVVFHRFIPTRSGFGATLWEGLGETSNNFGAVLDDGVTTKQVHRVRPDLSPTSLAYDDYLQSKAISAIKSHPGHYVELLLRRSIWLLPLLLLAPWRRRWSRERWLLAAVALTTIVPYIVLHMETRYWGIAGFTYLILLAIVAECALEALGVRWLASEPTQPERRRAAAPRGLGERA